MRVTKRTDNRSWIIAFDGISGVGKSDFALIAVSELTQQAHCKAVLFHENSQDPIREITSRVNKQFETWGLPADQVNGVLFAVGRALIMPELKRLSTLNDIVVCDRALWSNICYQSDSNALTMEQIFDLNVMLGVIVPDVTFIIDGDIQNCLIRRAYRDKKVVGTAGQMGGDAEKRERIRKRFLELPKSFANVAPIEVVKNPGDPIKDDDEQRWQLAQYNFRKEVIPLLQKYSIVR